MAFWALFLTFILLFGCNGKPPEPGKISVEICKTSELLANEFCRTAGTAETREYIKGQEPKTVCEVHPKVIEVDVCSGTIMLPNEWCEKAGTVISRKFIEGKEPTETCDIHKKIKLSENLTYHKLGKIYSAFFLKGGLCLKPNLENYTEEDFKTVIDYIAENDLSNVVRVFFWMNFGWEANANEIVMPHPMVNGRYDLHTINPLWRDQIFRRLDYIVERRLTVRLIINDGCSNRGWHSHWLDGDNNHGWNGKPTYQDKYGWTHWVHLQDPNYGNPDERARYAATRDYLLFMYEWIFTRLEKYKPYIIIDNNEVESYATWHGMMANLCRDYGFTRKYMITSPMAVDYIKEKPVLYQRWVPELHGVNSVAKYEASKTWIPEGVNWCPSADGGGEKWINMGKTEAVRLLGKSLADGNLGYQGNSEGVWSNMNPKIYEIARGMRDEILTISR